MDIRKVLKKINITWILKIFIVLFFVRYIIAGLFLFFQMNELDDIFYCVIFLFVPFLGLYASSFFIKTDYLILYFALFSVQWILFLNVNPYPIQLDNKFSIMELFPEKYIPEVQFMFCDIKNKNFEYPIVVKPIKCSGCGKNVFVINNQTELNKFIINYPNNKEFMVQTFLRDHNIELGVLYEKYPWEENGKIIEISEKTNYNSEIKSEYGKNIVLHTYLLENEEVKTIFKDIANTIHGANVLRYDIRLKKLDDLEKGDFKIIEANGTMGMSLYKDFDMPWYVRRMVIGLSNILLFKGYSPINLPVVMYKSFMSMNNCNDYENLFSLYS